VRSYSIIPYTGDNDRLRSQETLLKPAGKLRKSIDNESRIPPESLGIFFDRSL
jgi:hypothetical protein